MRTLDWLILAGTALFAVSGFMRGFIVGALSLIGFVAGAVAGTRLAAALLPSGSSSPYAPLFGLFGALLAGGILASGLEGVGRRVRRSLRVPLLGVADEVLGALFSAAVALGIAWVLGAAALALPGASALRAEVSRSVILRRLDELLPPSGPLLQALARFDPLPALGGPVAAVAPPSALVTRAPAVAVAARSVVRVLGSACGLGIEGSGWVVAPGEVLTNAHVVAGERDTVVEVGGVPPDLPATPILYDVHDDLALLRVDGLALAPLKLATDPRSGTGGAIVGYPQDGPLRVVAARIGATRAIVTQDSGGRGPVTRVLTTVRGEVRPGNSGGPLLDAQGRVLTTVFAATTSPGPRGGYGVANTVLARALAHAKRPTDTGACGG
jgi:S1-C subfamily serine protease